MAIFQGRIRHKQPNGTYDYLLPETLTNLVRDQNTNVMLSTTLANIQQMLSDTTLRANNPYTTFVANGNKITPNDLSADTLSLINGGTVTVANGYLENNRGVNFPLKFTPIAGITNTTITSNARNAILDAKIFNAVPGMVYRLTYISNGNVSNGQARYGITLEEHDASLLATGNSRTRYVFIYNDESNSASNANYSPTSMNIDTIILSQGSLTVSVTVDRTIISASTIPQALNLGTQNAMSFIIDQANYYY